MIINMLIVGIKIEFWRRFSNSVHGLFTDQLNFVANDRQLPWTESFGSCDDPKYWHQIFNNCQPDSCNASSVADTIINKPKYGSQQYWIYGYVLRSPAIANIGNDCESLFVSIELNTYYIYI